MGVYTKSRDYKIHCRATKEEREMLDQKAEARNMKITDYILYLIKNDKLDK